MLNPTPSRRFSLCASCVVLLVVSLSFCDHREIIGNMADGVRVTTRRIVRSSSASSFSASASKGGHCVSTVEWAVFCGTLAFGALFPSRVVLALSEKRLGKGSV